MDLSTLLWRVDSGWYLTVDAFLRDARLIVTAAKAYWGGLGESAAERSAHAATREAAARRAADPEGRQLVSRAHALDDTVREMAGALDPGLVLRCATIARPGRARRERARDGAARRGSPRREGEGADAATPRRGRGRARGRRARRVTAPAGGGGRRRRRWRTRGVRAAGSWRTRR